jgi:hypothetical protein
MRELAIQCLVEWCEEQREIYKRQIALMEANMMRTGEARDGKMVDTTAENIDRVKALLSELDDLLARYTKASLH